MLADASRQAEPRSHRESRGGRSVPKPGLHAVRTTENYGATAEAEPSAPHEYALGTARLV
jgi:hypothetical protein